MTFLVRKLFNGGPWSKLKLESPNAVVANLPPWIFAEFAPRPSDGGWLSCYLANSMEPAELTHIAGAMSLFAGVEAGKARQYYVGVDRKVVLAAGFDVRQTAGDTYNLAVDKLHEEIEVSDLPALEKLAELFWLGAYAEIKGAKIAEARASDARQDQIRFADAIKKKQVGHEAFAIDHVRLGDLDLVGTAKSP